MSEVTALSIPSSGALARLGAPNEREYLIGIMAETLGIPAKDAMRPDVLAILGMAVQQTMTYGALPGIHIHVQKFETKESRQKRQNNQRAEPEYTYTLVQGEKLYKDSGARWRIYHGVQWTYQRKAMTAQELSEHARQMGYSGPLPPLAFGMWSRIIMIGVDDMRDPENPMWSSGVFLGKRKVGNNWYDEDLPTQVTSRDVAIRRADKRAMMQSSLTLLPVDDLAPERRVEKLTDHLRAEAASHRVEVGTSPAPNYQIEDDGEILFAAAPSGPPPQLNRPIEPEVDFGMGDKQEPAEFATWEEVAAPTPEIAGARPEAAARPASKKVPVSDGPCTECHAPAGKPHATSCSQRAGARPEPSARPKVDEDGVIESELDVYAAILHNPEVYMDEPMRDMIIRFQEAHKTSKQMLGEDAYRKLRVVAQGIFGGEAADIDIFLSCMAGIATDAQHLPGAGLWTLYGWLNNPNKHQEEVAILKDIMELCRLVRQEIAE